VHMNASTPIQDTSAQRSDRGIFTKVLWGLVGYCALSCLTLPFISRWWLGELPVLAVIQLPKIAVAGWLRTHVVMEVITWLGLSAGSFSPDYILARPYALAVVYLIPMVIVGVVGLYPLQRMASARGLVTAIFLVAATLDYVFTLIFADGRSLTIY